jgi:pimeloyl-ACP methyl ester carboxylesterase
VLSWADCRPAFAASKELDTFNGAVACAKFTVPLDWSAPNGATTAVAVVRLRSTTQHDRIGSLVVNPGGPGGAGVEYLTSNWSKFGLPLADRFDLVGFDPRGVGSSHQVSCISDADKTALVSLPAPIAEALPVLSRIAARCTGTAADPLIARMGTMAVVHDLDALRASLGDDKLTFFGYSYGSEIATGYAALYPDRVRALVADGAIDVYGTQSDSAMFSAAGTDRGLQTAADLCRVDAPCTELIADPLGILDTELARAATTPVVTGGRMVTPVTIGLASYVAVSQLTTVPIFFQGLLALRDRIQAVVLGHALGLAPS